MTNQARDLIQRLVDALEMWKLGYGSTAADTCIIQAASAYLAQPEPEGLSEEGVADLIIDLADQQLPRDDFKGPSYLFEFARAAIARYGNRTPVPVPLSERQPTEADCDAEGKCWACGELSAWMRVDRCELTKASGWRAWLPHWALPMPAQEAEQ